MNKTFKKIVGFLGAGALVAFSVASPVYAGVPSITSAKITGPNTLVINYSEAVTANAGDYSKFSGDLTGRSVASLGGNGSSSITLTLNGDPLPAGAVGYVTVGTNTVSVSGGQPFPGGVFSVADAQAPSLVSISIGSNDGMSAIGKVLKRFDISFRLNEAATNVSATVLGRSIAVNGSSSGPYSINYTMTGSDSEGNVPVVLSFTDASGNSGRASMSVSTGGSSSSSYSSNLITSNANSSGVLKIGDSILFTLTPSSISPNARVNGSYNGVPLSWYTNNGGATYNASYIVSAGNSDQPSPLQISGVSFTDQFGVVTNALSGNDIQKTIVASAPSIYQVTGVPTSSNTATPSYSFNSSKAGTIRYGGDCSSPTNYAYSGLNTVTFNVLSTGVHSNCTIIVADAAGNASNQINVPSFTVVDGAAATAPSVTTNPSSSATNPTANDLMAQLALLQNQLANAKSAQGNTSSGSSSTKYVFTKALSSGSSGTEVLELQKRLKSEGYLTATPNGNYGPATVAAVKAYQKAKGLSQLGTVGPGTRAALNK
jgi:hypothetical protein